MVGNIIPKFKRGEQAQNAQFMQAYCSLCNALRTEHSLPMTLLLNTELSLVLLAIENDLPDKQVLETRCPTQLMLKKRAAYQHEAASLAAELSVILAWLKVQDNLADDSKTKWNPLSLNRWIEKKLGKKASATLKKLSPNTEQVILDYIYISQTPEAPFAQIRKQTNDLSRALSLEIVERSQASEEKKAIVTKIFAYVGELIAVLDPILDLKKDWQKHKLNPIVEDALEKDHHLEQLYANYCDQYLDLEQKILNLIKEHKSELPLAFQVALSNSLEYNRSRIQMTGTTLFGKFQHQVCEGSKTLVSFAYKRRFSILRMVLIGTGIVPLFGCDGGGGGCGGGNDCGNDSCQSDQCNDSMSQCTNTLNNCSSGECWENACD